MPDFHDVWNWMAALKTSPLFAIALPSSSQRRLRPLPTGSSTTWPTYQQTPSQRHADDHSCLGTRTPTASGATPSRSPVFEGDGGHSRTLLTARSGRVSHAPLLAIQDGARHRGVLARRAVGGAELPRARRAAELGAPAEDQPGPRPPGRLPSALGSRHEDGAEGAADQCALRGPSSPSEGASTASRARHPGSGRERAARLRAGCRSRAQGARRPSADENRGIGKCAAVRSEGRWHPPDPDPVAGRPHRPGHQGGRAVGVDRAPQDRRDGRQRARGRAARARPHPRRAAGRLRPRSHQASARLDCQDDVPARRA